MKRLLIGLLFLLLCSTSPAQVAVGHWRSYPALSSQLWHLCQAGSCLYAAGAEGIFCYDSDEGSVEILDKSNGLHDAGFHTNGYHIMAYDEASQYFVLTYANGNIDLLHNNKVYNISDIRRSSFSGINSVRFNNRKAYLACNFGLVVINLERKEIEDTYYLGANGEPLLVYDLAFVDSLIVVATERGYLVSNKDNPHLNIVSNWTLSPNYTSFESTLLEPFGNSILVYDGNTNVSRLQLNSDRSLQVVSNWATDVYTNKIHVCGDKAVIVHGDSVAIYNSDFSHFKTITHADWLSKVDANDAILIGNLLYVATRWAGLVSIDINTLEVTSLSPNSIRSDDVYRIVPFRDQTLVCQGGKNTTFANSYHSPVVSIFQNNKWTATESPSGESYDILDIAVNPRNRTKMMAAAWSYGILEYKDGKPTQWFTPDNTDGALQYYTSGSSQLLRTGAITYNLKGDAWMTNSLVDNGLVVCRYDGTWEGFNTSAMVGGNELDKILYDSIHNYIWFSGKANRIYVHDGKDKMAYVDPNNGSKMETASVNCIVQDHDGDIWIGTNKGLKVISNGYQAFANGGEGEKSPVNCSNITISNGDFAEYLMAYENVTCIAVDGANRKWVGTASGGLYLISPSGLDELEHFTEYNSPLYSNKIISVAVQPQTGDVFVGTMHGLQSYRGTATYANAYAEEELHIFPNPVKPDYDGPIAIKGFSRNALVHISDAAGHVVYSNRSTGGQCVWNGRTNQGEKVASGVYFVFASDDAGKNRLAGKILIIR